MLEIATNRDEILEPESQAPTIFQSVTVGAQKSLRESNIATHPATFEPIVTMAQRLKDHVEFALFTHPIGILGVTYPVFFKSNHEALMKEVIQERVGINPSLSYFQSNSAVASASANGIGMCQCPLLARGCEEEHFSFPPQMVLAIDYSDLFLTMFLYERRRLEEWRGDKSPSVHRTVPIGNHRNASRRLFWAEVISELKRLFFTADSRVDHIVLSGSRAAEPDLHDAIQAVFGNLSYHGTYYYLGNHERLEQVYNQKSLEAMGSFVDPSLAAAQGVADRSWRLNMRLCLGICGQDEDLPSCYENYPFPRFRRVRSKLWELFIEQPDEITS